MEPLFLKGVLQDKIWGGTKLRDEFGYDIPTETTGEMWAISAHPNGPAIIKNGEHAGKSLSEVWNSNPEIFGNQKNETFPLLIKIIDAQEDLSVQVHPNDAYGLKYARELGKTECWYILSADVNSEIVFGHNAQTEEQFRSLVNEGNWTDLLRSVKVKAGDFFYVPSGTVHAIGKGVMVLETQQSSDTTYRLYDYDRRDDTGKLRELHINKAIDVTTIPHKDEQQKFTEIKQENGNIKRLISNEFFTVYEWNLKGEVSFIQEGLYTLVSVVEGRGEIQAMNVVYKIKKGDHFILPNNIKQWKITGEIRIIASHP